MTQQYSKRWLTPLEMEEYYKFSASFLAKNRMKNNEYTIPYSKLGRKFVRYDRLEVDKFLEAHKIGA